MAAPLDFPNNPAVGQIYQQYRWDGTAWEINPTAAGVQPGPGLKLDNTTTPPTLDVATPYVPIAGGTMTGALAVNLNAASLPAGPFAAVLHMGAADGQPAMALIDDFGTSPSAQYRLRSARGTAAAPTAVQLGDPLGFLAIDGYDGSAYGFAGQIVFSAAENFSPTAHGSKAQIYTVTPGSTSGAYRLSVGQGVIIGNVQPPDPGPGALLITQNASGALPTGGANLHVVGADGVNTLIDMDVYGAGRSAIFQFNAARGTGAAPAAIQSGDVIGSTNYTAYDGAAFGFAGAAQLLAVENWTSAAHGTQYAVYTMQPGTTSGTYRMRVKQGVVIGQDAVDPGMGCLLIKQNTATPLPPIGSPIPMLRLAGPDGGFPICEVDAYGNVPIWRSTYAGGTAAAPTPPALGQDLGVFQVLAWTGTGYALGAQIRCDALEAWSGSANGADIAFDTTTIGTTTTTQRMAVRQGLMLYSAGGLPTGGDKGQGTINVGGDYYSNGVHVAGSASGGGDLFLGDTAQRSVLRGTNLICQSGFYYFQNAAGTVNLMECDGSGNLTVTGTLAVGGTSPQIKVNSPAGSSAICEMICGSGAGDAQYVMVNGNGRQWLIGCQDAAIVSNGYIVYDAGIPAARIVIDTAGNCSASSAWSVISDQSVKKNIEDHPRGLADVLKLQPRRYRYNGKHGFEADAEGHGLVAQELAEVMPELVREIGVNEDGERLLAVKETGVIWPLITAVKELTARLEKLEQAKRR